MFGPLSFEESELERLKPEKKECFLCTSKFDFREELDVFLKHIFDTHHLVVEDIQNIERLDQYVSFWKEKFVKTPIESIVPSVRIDGTNRYFFVLSILLNDDKYIRHKIKLVSKRRCLLSRLSFTSEFV